MKELRTEQLTIRLTKKHRDILERAAREGRKTLRQNYTLADVVAGLIEDAVGATLPEEK